jgi:Putative adhesin
LTIVKAVPGQAGGKKPGLSRTMLVVIIVVIAIGAVVSVVAVSLFLGPSLSVTTKNFAPYQSSVSQNSNSPSSMTVVNTNGGVTTSTWSQAYVMINGTVIARGFGTSTDAVTFVESNSSGNIVFQAIFPATSSFFFGSSYTVDIHVYEPVSYQFNTVQIVTVNGDLQLSSVTATSLTLTDTNGVITASSVTATTTTVTDTNGSINLTCASCGSATVTMTNGNVNMNLTTVSLSGSYVVTTTNGNVNLTLPALASFKITPNTTNGTISSSGLSIQLTNHTTTTLGTGSAVVNLTTTNGSITVTGK